MEVFVINWKNSNLESYMMYMSFFGNISQYIAFILILYGFFFTDWRIRFKNSSPQLMNSDIISTKNYLIFFNLYFNLNLQNEELRMKYNLKMT